ncbi:7 transmembrane receptor (rhodopsin family) domain-containing protein [Ditylenchus destructor]|uniref:7 transmembrane receptor (Rhodopsin family) domain-containing protein n=1 Tax=Ditylenchus destructor TaxID=166010 RepID=A0AAD4NBC9_9BILA|nr:7 transmembrane receptor (rhodopsin family) domain-containing protein [Ditylenchus destructor]
MDLNASTSLAISTENDECFPKSEAYDDFRFALVAYVGSPIAVLGIFSNAILIKLFYHKKRLKTPTFYLFVLAIFDTLICAIYLPFFTIDAISIYYDKVELSRIWHSYAMPLYGTSRVVQFASTYMVVCATLERFIAVANLKRLAYIGSIHGRYLTVGMTLLGVFILRIPAFFDYRIEHNENCPSFQDYSFTPWLMVAEQYRLFNFYVICFLHILVPFLLLLVLNILIIALTKKKIYKNHKFRPPGHNFVHMPQLSLLLRKESRGSRAHRAELRYATRTMVMITFTYLFCNLFNVIITVMEHTFKHNTLMFNEDGSSTKFYTYTADLISITVTVNSFARVFVYFFCNPQFRFQLLNVASQWWKCCNSSITVLNGWNHCLRILGRDKENAKRQSLQATSVLNLANNTISSSKSTLYV